MITKYVQLGLFNWDIYFLINCDYNNIDNITTYLTKLHTYSYIIEDIITLFNTHSLNKGVTYSNYNEKYSIIIIGKGTTLSELWNTTVHELYHFTRHLSKYYNTSEESEATLIGNISALLYSKLSKVFKQF